MMPRERISFERCTISKSLSGQRVKEWVPASDALTNVPVERRKKKTSDDYVLNAKEEFIEVSLTFWLRYNDSITMDLRIIYNLNSYRIIDIDRNYHDNSCLITCVKENK